jgi:hypothetical protein
MRDDVEGLLEELELNRDRESGLDFSRAVNEARNRG